VGSSIPKDFKLQVALGRVPGYHQEFLIAVRESQGLADGEITIWDHSQDWAPTIGGAEYFISSTSILDTGPSGPIVVANGLDSSYRPKFSSTALNGQSQVSIGTDWLYVQLAYIEDKAVAGDVYIATTDTLTGGVPDDLTKVKSKINFDDNITHNGFYIVPEGKVIAAIDIRLSTDSNIKTAVYTTCITPKDQPSYRISRYDETAGVNEFTFSVPLVTRVVDGKITALLDEKSTFEIRSEVVSENTRVFYSADFLVIDKTEIGIIA